MIISDDGKQSKTRTEDQGKDSAQKHKQRINLN